MTHTSLLYRRRMPDRAARRHAQLILEYHTYLTLHTHGNGRYTQELKQLRKAIDEHRRQHG